MIVDVRCHCVSFTSKEEDFCLFESEFGICMLMKDIQPCNLYVYFW